MTDRGASPDALLQALESVQFVIGRDGHQSGVFIDSAGWEALLDWLEDLEDRALVEQVLPKLRLGPVESGAVQLDVTGIDIPGGGAPPPPARSLAPGLCRP